MEREVRELLGLTTPAVCQTQHSTAGVQTVRTQRQVYFRCYSFFCSKQKVMISSENYINSLLLPPGLGCKIVAFVFLKAVCELTLHNEEFVPGAASTTGAGTTGVALGDVSG